MHIQTEVGHSCLAHNMQLVRESCAQDMSTKLTAQALTETICCSTCSNRRSTWVDEECPAWLEVASCSSSLLRVQARAVQAGRPSAEACVCRTVRSTPDASLLTAHMRHQGLDSLTNRVGDIIPASNRV